MRYLISFLLSFFPALGLVAQSDCIPQKDNDRLVYDGAGALSSGQADELNQKLIEFARTTSNQIVVALVDDLCGFTPEQLATEIGDSWGVGQNKEDNGIVVLVKPFGGQGERHAFIAVGKGLEGAIPDATAYQIVQNEMIPNFKQENFYGGIVSATTVLMELAGGEYNSDAYAKRTNQVPWKAGLIVFVIFMAVVVFAIARTKKYASTNNIGFWTAMMLLNQAGRSHRGTWGNFSGGSGGFGGGGGFGGFGGGSFGGGGAGGSW